LLGGYGAEGSKHGAIISTGVEEKYSNNFLNTTDAGGIEFGRYVVSRGKL